MKTENEIIDDMRSIEEKTIDSACELLSTYGGEMRQYLARIAASLCCVEENEIMANTKNIDIVQARWFFWYAYRYMTNESYESMAQRSKAYRHFSASCVGASVAKMSMMISKEPIWTKRWTILKRIVKIMLKNINNETPNEVVTLTITHPKGVTIELKPD